MSKNAMSTQVEMVGAVLAAKWLEDNYEQNRPLRWTWVVQLAQRIKDGSWKLTHQGLAFDEDGKLIDGQHRLWAIVESGQTVSINVSRNVPREAFHALDQHKIRSVSDLSGDKWVTQRIVAIAKSMARGPQQNHSGTIDDRDPSVLLRFIDDHRESIEKILTMLPDNTRARGRGNATIIVTACLIRASHHIPMDALDRFLQVLVSGEASNAGERAALLLRDWLMATGGRRDRSVEYQKTQRAIKAFVDADPIERLFGQPDDLYPLPDLAARRAASNTSAKNRVFRSKQRKRASETKGSTGEAA